MPNYNKVILGDRTLIDLSSDTVTADKLLQGYTAHDKNGIAITGTNPGGGGSATPGSSVKVTSIDYLVIEVLIPDPIGFGERPIPAHDVTSASGTLQ